VGCFFFAPAFARPAVFLGVDAVLVGVDVVLAGEPLARGFPWLRMLLRRCETALGVQSVVEMC